MLNEMVVCDLQSCIAMMDSAAPEFWAIHPYASLMAHCPFLLPFFYCLYILISPLLALLPTFDTSLFYGSGLETNRASDTCFLFGALYFIFLIDFTCLSVC